MKEASWLVSLLAASRGCAGVVMAWPPRGVALGARRMVAPRPLVNDYRGGVTMGSDGRRQRAGCRETVAAPASARRARARRRLEARRPRPALVVERPRARLPRAQPRPDDASLLRPRQR